MASEKSLANLLRFNCFKMGRNSIVILLARLAILKNVYPLFGVEWKVAGIGHHVDGEISYLDEGLSIGIQQDGSVEQETAKFEQRMER